jgi:hypothetical protein
MAEETVMPTPRSASRECRGSSAVPTFQGERFNSEIIPSMIESLICGSSRRATRLDVSVTGSNLQGEHV